MATAPIVPDLDSRLVALLSDLKDAEHASDRLGDTDLSLDIGILLHRAREAVQEAAELLDATQPIDVLVYEPRTYRDAERVVSW